MPDGGIGPLTNGACGKSNGETLGSAPKNQLCAAGTASKVSSDVTEIVETYYEETKYPALLHTPDGRLVVSPYYANGIPASMWQSMEQTLATAGYPIYFVPVFLSLESGYVDDYSPISDGMGDWGTAGG